MKLAPWYGVVFIACTACAHNSPTVTIAGGRLKGVTTGSGAVFKGIPFASSPVGDLRWREPAPVKPWSGIRDATKFGSRCMQTGRDTSEDCLYLNIWTPEWPPKSRKPVMLWIHGGGNFAGAGSDAMYDGESLARHDVVLITANYRLGVFGFFAYPELTAESPHHSSGNYGLMDQIAALKWVRDNIPKFGGDPQNVTIFGESAGSIDINILMTSPLARGLYARVIGESGPVVDRTTVAPPGLADAEKKGVSLAAELKADSMKAMRAIPAEDLQQATGPGLQFLGPLLGVVVDGWIIPMPPLQVFQAGQQRRVDLLLGSNAREYNRPFLPTGLREGIEDDFGPLAPRALKVYGLKKNGAEPPADPVLGSAMAQWATDSEFRCGTVAQLIWHSRAGNRSYQFQFSRVPSGQESLGATHGSELPYVFGTLSVASTAFNAPSYDATDDAISAQIEEYWTNFAKRGDPNGGSMPKWPSFDPVARGYIDLTAEGPVPREGLRREACDLFIESLEWKQQPLPLARNPK